nr:MAG: hypothetical protein [Apis mellifra filamentous-like virus]
MRRSGKRSCVIFCSQETRHLAVGLVLLEETIGLDVEEIVDLDWYELEERIDAGCHECLGNDKDYQRYYYANHSYPNVHTSK